MLCQILIRIFSYGQFTPRFCGTKYVVSVFFLFFFFSQHAVKVILRTYCFNRFYRSVYNGNISSVTLYGNALGYSHFLQLCYLQNGDNVLPSVEAVSEEQNKRPRY